MRLARFAGTNRDEFLDNKQITGNAFKLLEEAFHFINRHLPIASTFDESNFAVGNLERTDTPALPPEALREALVNAIAHRDYSFHGGAISLAIYDDRVEIWSDGNLPRGVSVAELESRHASKPRNELIAGVLYRRNMIEEWGRGTLKIIDLCVDAELPKPVFIENDYTFCVELEFKNPLSIPSQSQDKRHKKTTRRQLVILQILADHDALSLKDISKILSASASERVLRYDLYDLKRQGKIDTIGHGRGSKWYLVI